MDLATSDKAIHNGAVVGFLVGGVSLAVVAIAVSNHSTGILAEWDDPWNFLDAVLLFGLSAAVLRRSRTAAIFLFTYFILTRILKSIALGHPSVDLWALIFIYMFGKAIQGTFAYHRIRLEQDPEYKAVRKQQYIVWVTVSLIGAVLAGLIVFRTIDPMTGVLTGE